MRWSWLVVAVVSAACSDSVRPETYGGTGASAGSSSGSGATGGTGGIAGASGSSGVGGAGGSGGTAGVGGMSGQGGSGGNSGTGAVGGNSGTGAVGGNSGTGAVGGNSGTGAVGGNSGTGGAGGTPGGDPPQCESDRDCVLQSDCCHCGVGLANGRPFPACTLACLVDTCTSMGVERATCAAGRCVLDVSCNENEALCDRLPPQCGAGQAPIVDACYGQCIDARLCREVTGCDVCTRDQVCVGHVSRGGTTNHCVQRPAECINGPTCECMGASVCTGSFNVCNEDEGAIVCLCPTC